MRTAVLTCLLLLVSLVCTGLLYAEKIPAERMRQILHVWPPSGWQVIAPGSNTPYPPYVADGEFSATIYRMNSEEKLWSAHITIYDQQNTARSTQMLNNFPTCKAGRFEKYPARICSTAGEDLGRHRLAYAAGRYLVEISVIGPLPVELPPLDLNSALIEKTSKE